MAHNEIIRKEFAKQAEKFGEKGLTLSSAEYLQWMLNFLALQSDFRVLDVATGTGHLCRAIAPHVKEVIAIDTTPEMLNKARFEIEKAGIPNITLQEGLAENLPYPDHSFDMVVSRLAIHHFEQPAIQIKEMSRVCKPEHVIGIIDLLSPNEEHLIKSYNYLERLRDPSHTRALTRDELVHMMKTAALAIRLEDSRNIEVNLERWLQMSGTDKNVSRYIREQLDKELKGEKITGMRPFYKDGQVMFLQTWTIIAGEKVAS